jgi:hypothetical protein
MTQQSGKSIATITACGLVGWLLVSPVITPAQSAGKSNSGNVAANSPEGNTTQPANVSTLQLIGPRSKPANQITPLDEIVVVQDDSQEKSPATTQPNLDEVRDEVPQPQAQTALSQTPLPAELAQLRDRLRKVLAIYYPKHLNTRDHSCWEMMHGIIAYGVDTKVFVNQPGGKTANGVGWMCFNQPCHGERLFFLDRGNQMVARRGPGLQGHLGQFLAIIAQSHVPADFPMKIGGKDFTIKDLIEHEKQDCRAGEELTFKLIGLSHYLDSDDTWTARDGKTWSIPRLIQEELKQPILRVAACGGTHRLMGHSYALYKRRKQGKPITGQFARADKFINDYHKYAYSLQNADGSFSTKWFEMREARADIDRRLKTTGHIFEWMVFSVPEEQLRDPRIVKAANYLVTALESQPNRKWEVGPLGHGLHALRIYDRRLFKPYEVQPPATTPPTKDQPAEPLANDDGADAAWIDDSATDSVTADDDAADNDVDHGTTGPSFPVKQPATAVTPPTGQSIRTARKPSPPATKPLAVPRLALPAAPASANPAAPEVPPIELLP